MLRARANFDRIYMALGSEHIPNTLEHADASIPCGYSTCMSPENWQSLLNERSSAAILQFAYLKKSIDRNQQSLKTISTSSKTYPTIPLFQI